MNIQQIPLEKIWADESFNCRGFIAPIDVAELVKDIQEKGLLQPLVVQEIKNDQTIKTGDGREVSNDGKYSYKLIAGFRRFKALTLLSHDNEMFRTAPCNVRENILSDVDSYLFNLSENIQRQDLDILQEAKAVQRLVNLCLTREDISRRLGKSMGWVQVRANLLDLPKPVQEDVKTGFITQSQIKELYTIYNREGEKEMYAAVREIKDAKIAGKKDITVNPNRKKPDAKLHRKRSEIFNMMETIQDSPIGNGLWTRTLAWAAGEISTHELYIDLKNYDDSFVIPEE